MKRKNLAVLLIALCGILLLSGCGLLRREYSTVEPHSATYYESGSRDVLRAESYQDLVNALMLLVGAHEESGTVWLYDSEDISDVSQAAQNACTEVQSQTPLGTYALEYMTFTMDEGGRGYTQLHVTAGYRRTAQQMQAMVHATNIAALQDLLQTAAQNGSQELVVEVSDFAGTRQEVLRTVEAVRENTGETWTIHFYPDTDHLGIIEIILKN